MHGGYESWTRRCVCEMYESHYNKSDLASNYILVHNNLNCIPGTMDCRLGRVSSGLLSPKRSTHVLENLVPCLTTFSTASRKSRSDATFRRARIANIPAYSVHQDLITHTQITKYLCSDGSQFSARSIRTKSGNEIKAYVSFNTHAITTNKSSDDPLA